MKSPRSTRCQVCRHPERWRIELLKAGGASLDSLAAKFNIHRDAVRRHWRDHVSDETKAGYLAGPLQLEELAQKAADTGMSVLDHLHAIRVMLMGQLSIATDAGDGHLASTIAGRLTHTLEVIARISGELGALATNTTYNFVNNVAVLAESPAYMRVQAALLQALAPYPDARAAVVSALRELDEPKPLPVSAAPRAIPSRIIDNDKE